MQAERERAEIRERLSKVDEWKQRREQVEAELARVWVDGGDTLAAPEYVAVEEEEEIGGEEDRVSVQESVEDSVDERFEESVEELGESAADM